VAGSKEAKQRVAQHPDAIAYVERSAVDDSVRIISPQR